MTATPDIDVKKAREGCDLHRDSLTFLRTLKFRHSDDGKKLMSMMDDCAIRLAESHLMGGLEARPKATRTVKGADRL